MTRGHRRDLPLWILNCHGAAPLLAFLVGAAAVVLFAVRVFHGGSPVSSLPLPLIAVWVVVFVVSRVLRSVVIPHDERGYLRVAHVGRDPESFASKELWVTIITQPRLIRTPLVGEMELTVTDADGRSHTAWKQVDGKTGIYDVQVAEAPYRGAKEVTVSLWRDRERRKLLAQSGPFRYS